MTKGFIFKYSAEPDDPLMKDKLGTSSVCGLGLRDPDFWSNDFPVWAICGPYYRNALVPRDVVFFAPKKSAIRKAGLEDYVCTGILVVEEKLHCSEDVMTNPRLDSEYKKKYKSDLAAHLKRDRARTKKIRSLNFVIGNSSNSIWIGRNQEYLRTALDQVGLHGAAKKLSFRRIPPLKEQDVRSLYRRLVGKEL
jgi:hypothetical protein